MQDLLALLVVLGAVAYLAWRFGWQSRKPRVRRGPDVTVGSLVKKTRERAADRKDR